MGIYRGYGRRVNRLRYITSRGLRATLRRDEAISPFYPLLLRGLSMRKTDLRSDSSAPNDKL